MKKLIGTTVCKLGTEEYSATVYEDVGENVFSEIVGERMLSVAYTVEFYYPTSDLADGSGNVSLFLDIDFSESLKSAAERKFKEFFGV